MRASGITLCFWVISVFTLVFTEVSWAAPKYPMISGLTGPVRWFDKDQKEGKPRAKQVLIEKGALETGPKAEVTLQLDEQRRLVLLPDSRLELPSISWESGEAPVVILKRGSFRWQEKPGKKYNIALRSDLFEFLSPQGDFVFSFHPAEASAEVKVVQGSMEFSAMNGEDTALVAAGQKCRFQGVREAGEIVYDVLLKGKKIPRGKLGQVENFTDEEVKFYSEARLKKVEAAEKKKRVEAARKREEKSRAKDDICTEPNAKLNQCVWLCENNPKKEKKLCRVELPEVHCVRKRCNANGEWAEATEISKEKASVQCAAQSVVKACDY